ILSTGSSPIKPPVEGFDGKNVFTLWNIPDTDRVYDFVKDNQPKTATVIGGGFIGLEMAENLAHRGIQVTVIEKADQVMAPMDRDMAQIVHQHLWEKGIDLIVENGVQKILHTDRSSTILLEDGKEVSADLVILSIGIRANSELAKAAGLELNARGGVIVDDHMQTSDENIFAVGDIIEVEDLVLKHRTMVPLAGPANKQGRIVADNILGERKEKYKGTQGTSIAKIFDLTVAGTGVNEKTLQREGKIYGKDYKITVTHSNSHAGYYPDAGTMTIKLIFGLDGKVLGAQIIGYDGVDKRIDVLATAIRLGASVYDLTELELAYAPPYSSAKDPVNMSGYTAVNQLQGLVDVIRVEEVDRIEDLGENIVLLDVRDEEERVMGYIPNSILFSLGDIRSRLGELDKNKEYITSCAIGLRGYIAARILKQHGFKVKNLMGGYRSYSYQHADKDHFTPAVQKFEDSGMSAPADAEPVDLDVCGLCCPGPIVEVSRALEKLNDGEILKVVSTDPGFYSDISSWAKNTGNELVDRSSKDGKFFATIKKKTVNDAPAPCASKTSPKEKTMIVFSGDLDKAIASFIIANGAAAMGNRVNMFFTFWGLNVLRRNEKVNVAKDLISKMFGMMMPRGSKKLGLSKMNMMGMGPKMIRSVMKSQNVYSLEELIDQAVKSGVKIVACQMSMDVMGITKEELIDGVEIGGVATMLADNDNSNMNLF
ncbi:MAG: DsrE/DsrF/DrsH-like family protein, partial [Peptostreptococcaceae bacterium]|nr:DsrE/DsrF/DrsH-like family protein [Peptostreptococcaceae bacterium]